MRFGVLANIIIVLFAAVLVTTVLRRLRLPPILGYLLVGMIVGPYGLDWIADSQKRIKNLVDKTKNKNRPKDQIQNTAKTIKGIFSIL